MAQDITSTIEWKLKISEFKANIKQARQDISLANAEFKKATAGARDWAGSITGLEAKLKQLKTTESAQVKVLNELKSQLKETQQAMGEDSEEAKRLEIQITNQEAAIAKTQREIGKYGQALEEMQADAQKSESALGKLTKEIDDQEDELKRLKQEYANAIFGDNEEEAEKLAKEIEKVSSELAENKKKMEEAEKAADQFDKSLEEVSDSAESSGQGLNAFQVAIGNLIADGLRRAGEALKEFVVDVVRTGTEFDTSMSKVAALSGATGEEFDALREKALEMGSQTAYTATEASDALGYMALAGWDTAESIEALPGILNMAAAGAMDLAGASDLVTDYMSVFNLQAKQATYFSDGLAYAQANANTSIEQLGGAFRNAAATMSTSGQDFETTTALLATMADNGLKGERAGTALASVMRDITDKMKDGAIAIGDTSVAVMDESGNFRDLTDILYDVEEATNGLGDAERATALSMTFGTKSLQGLNTILPTGMQNVANFEEEIRKAGITTEKISANLEEFGGTTEQFESALSQAGLSSKEFDEILKQSDGSAESLRKALKDNGVSAEEFDKALEQSGLSIDTFNSALEKTKGTAEDTAETMLDNLGGDVTKLGSALDGVKIAIFDFFEPALRFGVQAITSFVSAIMDFASKNEWIIPIITAVAGALAFMAGSAVIGLLISAVGTLTAAFGSLTAVMLANPIGLIVAAVVGLVAGIVLLWKRSDKFRKFFENMWKSIKKVVDDVVKAVVKWWTDAVKKVESAWNGVAKWFGDLWNGIKQGVDNLVKSVIKFFTDARNTVNKVWQSIVTWFNNLWTGIKNGVSALATAIGTLFTNAKNTVVNVWNTVVSFFAGIWNGIVGVFSGVASWFGNMFNAAVNGIRNAFNQVAGFMRGVWNSITGIFGSVGSWFGNVFKSAYNAVTGAFNGLVNFFSGLWGKIKGVFTNLGSQVGNAVGGAVKNAINGVIASVEKIINSGISLINGAIDLANKLPGVNVGKVGKLSLPRLARGGVLDSGARTVIAGEAGAEAVVPLERNTYWIGKVAKQMLEALDIESIVKEVGAVTSQVARAQSGVSNSVVQNINFTQNITSPKPISSLDVYRDTKSLLFNAKVGLKHV